MPNWTYNCLMFKRKEDAEKVRAFVEDEKWPLDFNKIVPMPEGLNIVSGMYSYWPLEKLEAARRVYAEYLALTEIPCDKVGLEDLAGSLAVAGIGYDLLSLRDRVDLLREAKAEKDGQPYCILFGGHDALMMSSLLDRMIANIRNYGFPTWYEWSYANWGTKWNACDAQWADQAVWFSTAWSSVPDLMLALHKKTGVEFYYRFAEEQFDEHVGESWFHDGTQEERNYSSSSGFPLDAYKISVDMLDPEEVDVRWDPQLGAIRWKGDNEDEEDRDWDLPQLDNTDTELLVRFLG